MSRNLKALDSLLGFASTTDEHICTFFMLINPVDDPSFHSSALYLLKVERPSANRMILGRLGLAA